jgi:hypothetical protein
VYRYSTQRQQGGYGDGGCRVVRVGYRSRGILEKNTGRSLLSLDCPAMYDTIIGLSYRERVWL